MSCGRMTPRERLLAVLSWEKPDRLPMHYWATKEATHKVMRYLGCTSSWEMFERLHIDPVLAVSPSYVGPPIEAGADLYGCRYENIDYGIGMYSECIYHPLAKYGSVEDIDREYTWPTADWFDYSTLADQIEGKQPISYWWFHQLRLPDEIDIAGTYPIFIYGSEVFLIYRNLRGPKQAYMDLIIHPELAEYCLAKLFDFCYEKTLRIYEQIPGQVDMTYVSEDLGSQEGLLMSPQMIKRFLVPGMGRMMELAHQADSYVFHHSDGAIREIIPTMLEIGIDILNPIQWRCHGMEREALKRDFGERVILHGGIDNQGTLAFGSVEDVREEVAYNVEVLGAGGGYILAPCHNIQAVSPPENIVALYETGYELGQR